MNNKTIVIFSHSITSIICKMIGVLLLISSIIMFFQDYVIGLILLFFMIMYSYLCGICYGLLLIKKNTLKCFTDLDILKMQYGFEVKYSDIKSLDFMIYEKKSNGKRLNGRYVGEPPYLKINLLSGEEKYLYLGKYSKKQWKKLEKLITNRNAKIFVINNADYLIELLKHGYVK